VDHWTRLTGRRGECDQLGRFLAYARAGRSRCAAGRPGRRGWING